MTPLVSVIIPCYNAENFLAQTVNSVFSQTFTDYEIILVDDGSTDGTAKVIQSLIMMKIIQALGFYFPESCGGTEVYVDGLVQELHKLQKPIIKNTIVAPLTGTQEKSYEYNDVVVYRYPVFTNLTLAQIRDVEAPGGFEYFARWLKQQKADIFHQHSWATGCSTHHLRQAKKLGMATAVTVHVPGNICLRGTMLLDGQKACDGKIEQVRCGTCWGMARGIPASIAPLLSKIPLPLSAIAESEFSGSRLATALATPALVAMHQNRLQEMVALADRVVAVCQWLYDTLLINGVPKNKLVLCRQGIATKPSTPTPIVRENSKNHPTLRIGFLGRWDRVKGLHILVEAVRNLPKDVRVELIIYGLTQGESGKIYQQEVLDLALDDPRINFAKPLEPDAVPPAIANLDILAVPSQWLETGPLVVLEAQAQGTPILGSNLGGIAELISHGVNGWLVPASNVSAWSQAISHFAKERTLLAKLRQGIQPVRTMNEVATEMTSLYQEIYKK